MVARGEELAEEELVEEELGVVDQDDRAPDLDRRPCRLVAEAIKDLKDNRISLSG